MQNMLGEVGGLGMSLVPPHIGHHSEWPNNSSHYEREAETENEDVQFIKDPFNNNELEDIPEEVPEDIPEEVPEEDIQLITESPNNGELENISEELPDEDNVDNINNLSKSLETPDEESNAEIPADVEKDESSGDESDSSDDSDSSDESDDSSESDNPDKKDINPKELQK